MKNVLKLLLLIYLVFPLYTLAQSDTTHNIKVIKPEAVDPNSKGTLKIIKPDTIHVEKMDPSKDTIDQKKLDNMDPNKNIKKNSL